jgi:hypothetical protein
VGIFERIGNEPAYTLKQLVDVLTLKEKESAADRYRDRGFWDLRPRKCQFAGGANENSVSISVLILIAGLILVAALFPVSRDTSDTGDRSPKIAADIRLNSGKPVDVIVRSDTNLTRRSPKSRRIRL